MADRLQPRRDTAARWAAVNPVLLEGEWGVVTDNPAYYKIGDGVTAWNDLPFRGYDGTLVQTTGNGTQTVMSQKATTEAIAATEQRVEGKIGNLKEEMTDNYAKQNGTYRKMSVGFAENVVGDKSATEEEFSFRPTAGVNRNTLNDGAARIHSIKGRSVVANQKARVMTNTSTQKGITVINDGVKSIVTGTALNDINMSIATALMPVNHKCILKGCPTNGSVDTYFLFITDTKDKRDTGTGVLFTNTNNEAIWINITVKQGVTVNLVIYPCLYDLTQEFGAGNEPETVEEYYQRKPILLNEDKYNEGKLINLVPKAIKTTGFNQWDEQWQVGYWRDNDGTFTSQEEYVASKNLIKILPNTNYCVTSDTVQLTISYYDSNLQFIGRERPEKTTTNYYLFKTIQNAEYINFHVYKPSNKNICISLYWPTEYGNLYGAYQPYKPFVRDLSWVNKYFPATINGETKYGMRSAGNVADEIRFNSTTQKWEAIQKVGAVDLGSLTWTYSFGFFQTTEVNAASGYNILCSKYQAGDGDKEIRGHSGFSGYIIVRDSSFTDAATFKAAMQGVMLNYELAEPDVKEIDEIPSFDFDVSDYGTEELIVAEGEQSAPVVADIEYSPNVLAVLKNAPDIANDVDALKSQVAALTEQLAALTTANTNE